MMPLSMSWIKWIKSFNDFLFPRQCLVCGKRLTSLTEKYICASCLLDLPYTGIKGEKGNIVERLFWEIDIQRASSYIIYDKNTDFRNIFLSAKYRNKPLAEQMLATMMARDIIEAKNNFFDAVDLIIPVPISKKRKRDRGYNQSEYIAKGIASVINLPIRLDILKRIGNDVSQTRIKSYERRKQNVEGSFALCSNDKQFVNSLKNKHVLLVDDVITTSATLSACIVPLLEIPNIKISVISLAISSSIFKNPKMD